MSLMLFAGCSVTTGARGPAGPPGPPGPPGSPGPAATDHACPGANPGIVPININYNGPNIVVAPPNQEANEGDVLRFNLIGANDLWVSTSGKTSSDGWLNGSGRKEENKPASEKFEICVPYGLFPEGTKPGTLKEFSYNVDVETKSQLDPVVTVRKL
jgi:hypothetical protein